MLRRSTPLLALLTTAATALEAHELSVLLFGGDWAASKGAPLWRPVTPPD